MNQNLELPSVDKGLNIIHNTATDCWSPRLHSTIPSDKKLALLTTLSSNLMCESAAEHYSKISQKERILARSFSWYQASELQLWKQRRCFSKVILASNITPNVTRSSASFSTAPSRVNGVEWGCIVRNVDTITVIDVIDMNSHSAPFPKGHTTCWRGKYHDSGIWHQGMAQ